MSWEQEILSASVSINRSVWAINVRKFNDPKESTFRSKDERDNYIIQEVREAIKSLTNSLIELNNEINFKDEDND